MHSQQMFNECIARAREAIRPLLSQPRIEGCRRVGSQAHSRPQIYIAIERCIRCVLTYFPASYSEEEAQHVGLLLLLKLFEILEGTHFVWNKKPKKLVSYPILPQ